jgi:hypothetical protein
MGGGEEEGEMTETFRMWLLFRVYDALAVGCIIAIALIGMAALGAYLDRSKKR